MSAVARRPRRPAARAGGGCARILLASEGRPFTDAALARVIELAAAGAEVRVFSVARVHGVAFGMPNPGLLPTKQEWAEQRELVATAVKRLHRKGLDADGHVVGTRNAAKQIVQEARRLDSQAIVMVADPDRSRAVAGMMWSQEPQRVRRRARMPVHLVIDDGR